ncbi:hypothetical protein J2S43_006815 [Catenuloplanes nepalensis]|uniref:ABC transporter permease n=1 Tax=Catenuloplanes nepalensis TaxID=587533 RepID=A0ABT9N467_9ACTN|nr:ABC transporter permease [Catenuloplanes nepalensis]MDP9798303.1 hypothetical protein [Catenuloplanes nepalensis]
MTAPTTAPSAYPPAVDELLRDALELSYELGGVPSRNQLMKRFRIGAPKATLLREALTDVATPRPGTAPVLGETPAPPVTVPDPAPVILPVESAPELTEDEMPPPREVSPLLSPAGHPGTEITADPTPPVAETAPAAPVTRKRPVTWPVLLLCLPAFVAIWGGWVEMGRLTGFGEVALLPGIADQVVLDTAITLPIGVETYAAYALYVWLSGMVSGAALRFARASAIGSLIIGALGQVAYHLMASWGWESAPWPVTAVVACIPVAVLGMGAALAHLMHHEN